MLVLSRRAKQSILIGDDIEIVVNRIRGNTVSLGIKAPREISVTRKELTFNTETPESEDVPLARRPQMPPRPAVATSQLQLATT